MPTGIFKRSIEHRRNLSLALRGEINPLWRGNNIHVKTVHQWLRRYYGTANHCEKCGEDNPKFRYDWANINGHKYTRKIEDYKQLCRSCHMIMDRKNVCRKDHIFSKNNIYITPSSGRRRCLICMKNYRKTIGKDNNRRWRIKNLWKT